MEIQFYGANCVRLVTKKAALTEMITYEMPA
jgi:hypothetical protein